MVATQVGSGSTSYLLRLNLATISLSFPSTFYWQNKTKLSSNSRGRIHVVNTVWAKASNGTKLKVNGVGKQIPPMGVWVRGGIFKRVNIFTTGILKHLYDIHGVFAKINRELWSKQATFPDHKVTWLDIMHKNLYQKI